MHEGVSHKGYLAHGNGMRGRSSHQNNSVTLIRNVEERKVDAKWKSPKLSLACVEDLTINPLRELNGASSNAT